MHSFCLSLVAITDTVDIEIVLAFYLASLAFYLAYFLARFLPDILFGILFGILADVLFLAFFLTLGILTCVSEFILAAISHVFLAFYLSMCGILSGILLHSLCQGTCNTIWHFWQSIWHCTVTSLKFITCLSGAKHVHSFWYSIWNCSCIACGIFLCSLRVLLCDIVPGTLNLALLVGFFWLPISQVVWQTLAGILFLTFHSAFYLAFYLTLYLRTIWLELALYLAFFRASSLGSI